MPTQPYLGELTAPTDADGCGSFAVSRPVGLTGSNKARNNLPALDRPLAQAFLGQPSGVVTDGRRFFFVDSGVSALPVAEPGGAVRSLLRQGLFIFGDRDDRGPTGSVQHPPSFANAPGPLVVGDSLDHKSLRVDATTTEGTSLAAIAALSVRDGSFADAQLDEPGGVTAFSHRLTVADTKNPASRLLELERREVSTFEVNR